MTARVGVVVMAALLALYIALVGQRAWLLLTAGEPVAVLVHNKPSAYLVPAATYQRLLDRLEDLELAALVRARSKERRVKVTLDEL